ncbi:MAG: ribosomal protein S18-alanine N-acetyltransferase [Candidatus Marinimicrobia bacterium]|jgi:ribosomal-protein-alanine N-acetyltransferase|nr:ribosomal protein S18-alanine N-acetyltransferase [Candidatus Neomarinimicrobiota bacterium]MDP6612113.1 ribosomal protein S18-alanine N-acetyltransferase [Candidatus Neomarinimicrobiota bacterium]|tara:strand:+ start:10577 stop:10999 length:423 start_codon:yes stop_codon:yes gene_type:complete
MNIRKAILQDLENISKMEKRIFNDSWSKKSIRQELIRKENSLNLVAELDGKLIGYFFAHLVENEAHILNIALDIAYQHQDYGKQFLGEILNDYLKYVDVFLEVKRSNFPAINLYLHFGFEEIDIRESYYSDGEDAIVMVK